MHPAYYIACDNCEAQGPTTDKGTHADLWNCRPANASQVHPNMARPHIPTPKE
jgi:hypothetical protein